MTYVKQVLTNGAYGKREGGLAPIALACLHITGNPRTAKYTDLHAAAQAERNYANRAGSGGPSAHFYVARDGWAIMAINPELYWAWSNGDFYTTLSDGTRRWNKANLGNPGVADVYEQFQKKGVNANRAYWLEFENVGYGKEYPVTAKQRQFCAEQIAAMAKAKGMKINRKTVHGHWEINGIDRDACPSPDHEAFLNDVIARANLILNPPAPEPAPAPATEEDMLTITDRSEKTITLKVGAKLYHPTTGALVNDMSINTSRTSLYATAVGRLIDVSIGGVRTLLAVKADDPGVTVGDPVVTADPTPYGSADLLTAKRAGGQEVAAAAKAAADKL